MKRRATTTVSSGTPAAPGTLPAVGAIPAIALRRVHYSYGHIEALHGVSLAVEAREVVCIIGPNGAGKTTLARVLGGLLRPSSGEVEYFGRLFRRASHDAIALGVASVLEGRRLFADQTVLENLELGAYAKQAPRAVLGERLERVLTIFPQLERLRGRNAGTLSGGEQQMVAIGRALMSDPKVLILDEPSMGLAPVVAERVFEALRELVAQEMAIILVEQNAQLALELSTRGYVMQTGTVAFFGTTEELTASDVVRELYLGVGG